jgi:hypothetical protein
MKTIKSHVLLAAIAGPLLIVNSTSAPSRLTILEDSSTRLDFTVSWWDAPIESTHYREPTSDLVFGTMLDFQEHLPLLAVEVMSDYLTPMVESTILLWCSWDNPDGPQNWIDPHDRGYNRTLDSVAIDGDQPAWYQVDARGKSARFTFGAPPILPDGGSMLHLLGLGVTGCLALARPARHPVVSQPNVA